MNSFVLEYLVERKDVMQIGHFYSVWSHIEKKTTKIPSRSKTDLVTLPACKTYSNI